MNEFSTRRFLIIASKGVQITLWLFLLTPFGLSAELPYPVLFVHGIDSDDGTWDEFLNGTLRPALNNPTVPVFHVLANSQLADDATSWKGADNQLGTDDDDIIIESPHDGTGRIPSAPIYKINYKNWRTDTPPYSLIHYEDRPGILPNSSAGNESALVKEGIALGLVIDSILTATGKDKIILVGHSAGGLAIREYLQRTDSQGHHPWWVDSLAADGHHVARCITMGTPHLGSNLFGSSCDAPGLAGGRPSSPPILLPNTNAEMTRDLRYCHYLGGEPPVTIHGLFLFGGNEVDLLNTGFHNFDVDCNGSETDHIVGLSDWDALGDNPALPLPSGIEYLWYTSDDGLCIGGDCVVDLDRQYLHTLGDTMLTHRLHTNETSDETSLIRALDCDNTLETPWQVPLEGETVGWITYQPNMLAADFDYYLASLPVPTGIAFYINGADVGVLVRDANDNIVLDVQSGGDLYIELGPLPAGNLNIMISGVASQTSWQTPYYFYLWQYDNFPPATITDLSATPSGPNSIAVSWTASGDDGLVGTGLHTLRYSLSPIDEGNFDFATTVFLNQSHVGGAPSQHIVLVPFANTAYYLAMKVCDDAFNCSGLSNVVTVTTSPYDPGSGPQINLTETFFDTDPGYGNGILLPVGPGAEVSFTTLLDVSPLAQGRHTLYHRHRLADGLWSETHAKTFLVTPPAPTGGFQIVAAEYYFDSDPGIGNGVAVDVNDDNEVILIESPAIAHLGIGTHTLYLRYRANNGVWTTATPKSFHIHPAPSPLASAEYFFDNDPGVGFGHAIEFPDTNQVSVIQSHSPVSLLAGPHTLSLRYSTARGLWSATASRTLFVAPATETGDNYVASGELFLDSDPGIGQGHAMSPDDGAFDERDERMNRYLSVSALAQGQHYASVRVQDALGNWSHVKRDSFIVNAPLEIRVVARPDSTGDSLRLVWTTFPEAAEYRVYFDSLFTGSYSQFQTVIAPDTSLWFGNLPPNSRSFYRVTAVLHAATAALPREDSPKFYKSEE